MGLPTFCRYFLSRVQVSKQKAKAVLDEWVEQVIESKIQPLVKMASTIRAYKTYILAWYDHYITNGTIEGINNKIKVLKRQIYEFRNEEYFTLRLYALHGQASTHFTEEP